MKYISFVRYGLVFISAVIVILFYFTNSDATGTYPYLDLVLRWVYVMLIISVVIVVLFSVYSIFKAGSGSWMMLVSVGLLAAVVIISYFMSSNEPITTAGSLYYDDPLGLRTTDIVLYTTYIALTGAILAILFGEVVKLFKK